MFKLKTQSSSGLYTLISSAPFQRCHLSHTLHVIHSATRLLNSHASLLPFASEDPSEGPVAPFSATRARSVLLHITASLIQLLHRLVSQAWWPKKGQVFVQLTTQLETLTCAAKLSAKAAPEKVLEEIYEDRKFFDILLRPLLQDLQYALERAGADPRAWALVDPKKGMPSGKKSDGERKKAGGGEGGRRERGKGKKVESESGLRAVRPGMELSVHDEEALARMAQRERMGEEKQVRCEACGHRMKVKKEHR